MTSAVYFLFRAGQSKIRPPANILSHRDTITTLHGFIKAVKGFGYPKRALARMCAREEREAIYAASAKGTPVSPSAYPYGNDSDLE
jgi:hypothetical protein